MSRRRSKYEIVNFWNKHGFKILVTGSIILIIILYINNKDTTKGTWSLEYSYNPDTKKAKYVKESKGEAECRRVMEKLFMRAFPNRRPLFLMNAVTGKPLEIDCCNMDLRLGVEYNGRQHYEYTKGMHKNFEAFRIQQYRDEMKMRKCVESDFNLIIVPYKIPIESIENYLIEEVRKLGYKI
jgi:hypothetical protein